MRNRRIATRAWFWPSLTRGETQALVVTTLGTGQDEQIIDALEGEYRENFMLHYNFPPYSVGETVAAWACPWTPRNRSRQAGMARGSSASPAKDKFPYTMRVVSEITESTMAQSSMATVCGSSLSVDGCRRSVTSTCCRYRYGPDQGRSRLCGSVGYSGG